MSLSSKPAAALIPRLMLYRRPLHPELFNLQSRRVDRHGEYEVESWLTHGGHVVRFAAKGHVMTETVIDAGRSDALPEAGLVHALPCIGEKEYEHQGDTHLGYFATVQTEALSDNLYQSTYREMQDFAHETGALAIEWADETGQNLTMLDAQKYRKEYHFQAYHLLASGGQILRTQSIFEIL